MTNPKPKSEWAPRSPFAMTDAEIAERLGISRQRVSQIAIAAMDKIRREFERRGIVASDFYDVEG
ncbi:MAG: hypothetical protein KBG29_15905 [Pseudomonadales bacterium]|nr:hypothetical protein [Pseudomonadales bacterium]